MVNDISGIEFKGLVIGLFRARRDEPKKPVEIVAELRQSEVDVVELRRAVVGSFYDWTDVKEKASEMAGIISPKPKLIKKESDHNSIMKMSSG